MVVEPLCSRLNEFIRRVGEPYDLVEGVSGEGVRAIRHQSLRTVLASDTETRVQVLEILELSWANNLDHGRIRDWGRLASGIARYLLLPTQEAETEPAEAADVIVRLSRWRHNDGTGFFVRFVPDAQAIVRLLFRDIGDLYRVYSTHSQQSAHV